MYGLKTYRIKSSGVVERGKVQKIAGRFWTVSVLHEDPPYYVAMGNKKMVLSVSKIVKFLIENPSKPYRKTDSDDILRLYIEMVDKIPAD